MHRNAAPKHALGLRQRINNRRSVHPELHDEREQHLQVAVLGGHGRNQNAKTQSQASHHDDQEGEQQSVPVEMCARVADDGINGIDKDEETELYAETQQVRQHIGNGHRKTREINLAKNTGIVHKSVGSLGKAFREIIPHAGTSQIKQWSRHAVGGDACDATEHDHVHDDRQGGLHHKPQGSKNGLLILSDNITLDEKGNQIPIVPQLSQIHLEKLVSRLDDRGPLLFRLTHKLKIFGS